MPVKNITQSKQIAKVKSVFVIKKHEYLTNIFSFSFSTKVSSEFQVSSFVEHNKYNQSLHKRSVFPSRNVHTQPAFSRAVVSFCFRSIEFSKKRALPFFLAIELLTNRKCVASLSRTNVQAWKIRKGMLVGCKVVLRQSGFTDFVDTLALTFPRREKFQPSRWIVKQYKKSFSKISTNTIKNRMIQPTYAFSLGELVLFYPIELGLGLHPDVQRVEINFIFESLSIEERFFLLRSFKIPVLYL